MVGAGSIAQLDKLVAERLEENFVMDAAQKEAEVEAQAEVEAEEEHKSSEMKEGNWNGEVNGWDLRCKQSVVRLQDERKG